jgi:aspartate/methionine/tyrosine aminotransferase
MHGNSTFYFLVSIEDFPGSSLEFSLHMLLFHQIAVVPGSAYGQSCSRFVRVGIGTESEERIHNALMLMRDLMNFESYNSTKLHSKLEEEGLHLFEEKE